jgi:hypothetical protein
MAGAFTHMAIVSGAKDRFDPKTPFGYIFRKKLKFVTLGCVSPDVPYLSHLAVLGAGWADVMHYHQTNAIVHNAMHTLRITKDRDEYWIEKLAWLAGYVSHLVADATIHPIVEAIVGPCAHPASKSAHTECEMIQDVMIFDEVRGQELSASEYSSHLAACRKDAAYAAVMTFWSKHAMVTCPSFGEPDTEAMLAKYFAQIDTAEGGSAFARAFRHIGFAYVYKTVKQLKTNHKDLIKKYYTAAALPTGGSGAFRTEGFDRAVTNTFDAWSRMDRYLFSTDNISEIIPNWNLDTGFDQVTNKRTYWG